jgi:hypothetical protein
LGELPGGRVLLGREVVVAIARGRIERGRLVVELVLADALGREGVVPGALDAAVRRAVGEDGAARERDAGDGQRIAHAQVTLTAFVGVPKSPVL